LSHQVRCRLKPYIQPFERRLATSELEAFAEGPVRTSGTRENTSTGSAEACVRVPPKTLANRLAYYESVICGNQEFLTTQVLKEATVYAARNGAPLEEIRKLVSIADPGRLPNRRCLRYGTHGIHEYRGKFFPQLVRSLINIAEVPPNGLVADPMCGSGTTLVEAALAQCRSIGLDMNPLSVFMTKVKSSLLSADPDRLSEEYSRVRERLLSPRRSGARGRLAHFSALPASDQVYLREWFADQVLEELDVVARTVGCVEDDAIRDFMRLSLSNILRSVSWQKNEDLRVRKEVRTDIEIDPIREFLEELGRSVRLVLAFLWQTRGQKLGEASADEGDAREAAVRWGNYKGKVDVVITSPPYATALPYIDTDRLSLSYLGLLPRSTHRGRDRQMIGNREITERMRRDYWVRATKGANLLPKSVVMLIGKIDLLNAKTDAGFRRRNLPALLAKYFLDMRQVLSAIAEMLKPGARAFVVVGNNHTVARGQRVEIGTAKLLVELAAMVGLEPGDHIPMEMLVSRDIFRRNAVASEEILVFRKALQ